jgi:prepilin-type N-terminal cleavage/methylation domain-containing protein
MTGVNQWARLRRLHSRGFSAVEMLIVIAIFAVASVTITATYINFTHLHRRVANAEVLGEEMRFVAELLVRAARANTIEYPDLPTEIVSPSSTLQLVSMGDDPIWIQHFATSSSVCAGLEASCLGLSTDSGTNWSAITGKYVSISQFKVYITPTANPFDPIGIGLYDNDDQPRVTFLIDATYVSPSVQERSALRLQTSVSSRIYLR